MRRKSVPSRENSKSKGAEAARVHVKNIMKVNLTETEMWRQRGVVRD